MPPSTLERKAPARAAAKPKPSARPRKAELSSVPTENTATTFDVTFKPEVLAWLRKKAEACQLPVSDLVRIIVEYSLIKEELLRND